MKQKYKLNVGIELNIDMNEIDFEEIDEYSYQWGMSDDERTLAQYLGLNADEEDAWVSVGEDALRELLDKQKK